MAKRFLFALLAAFFTLGCVYNVVNPIFEASDELWHYPAVKYVADGHGLPDDAAPERKLWLQEGSQPPLYYAAAAALTFWIDTDDVAQVRRLNPHTTAGYARLQGNKNLVIHSDGEAFPYRRTALAVHLIRLFSTLLGLATVALTYLTALEVTEASEDVALLAAAMTAFNPMFIFVSSAVNNDALAITLGAAGVFILCRVVRRGLSWGRLLLLGLVLGLGALTKLSLLALLGLSGLVLAAEAWRRRSFRLLAGWGAALLGMVLAVAGWWYVHNWLRYGDPTALSVFLGHAGLRGPYTWDELLQEFEGFRISYWALFGGVNILADDFIYRLLDGLTLICGLGWLLATARCWRRGERQRSALLALLFGWALMVFISLIRWTLLTPASQGRLIFSALSAISVGMAVGLGELLPGKARRPVFVAAGVGLALFAVVAPFRYIAPAYARPPILGSADVPPDARQAGLDYDGQMRLLAYELPRQTVRPGEEVRLTVYWQSLREMEKDYSVFVHLLTPSGKPLGQTNTYPGLGAYPTTSWKPGDIVADAYRVQVERPISSPTLALVDVGLYDYHSARQGLSAHDPQGKEASTVIGAVKVAPWSQPVYTYTNPVHFELGAGIALLGYDLATGSEALHAALYWQALDAPGQDYQVLLHLLAPGGTIAAQGDGPPVGGDYPTSWWEAGEVIRDEHRLTLPGGLEPGEYTLVAGLYRLEDGLRLPVSGDPARIDDRRITLGNIWIK